MSHSEVVLQKHVTESVAQRCSVKKVFLEILQNSQENTCARVSFLIKLQALAQLWHRCFYVNFAKFLRTPFLTEHLQWLFLMLFPTFIKPEARVLACVLACSLVITCIKWRRLLKKIKKFSIEVCRMSYSPVPNNRRGVMIKGVRQIT